MLVGCYTHDGHQHLLRTLHVPGFVLSALQVWLHLIPKGELKWFLLSAPFYRWDSWSLMELSWSLMESHGVSWRPLGLMEKSNSPGANSRWSLQVTSPHCLCTGDPLEPSPPILICRICPLPKLSWRKKSSDSPEIAKPLGFCLHMQIKLYFKWQFSTSSLLEVLEIPWQVAYFPVGTAPVSNLACMKW